MEERWNPFGYKLSFFLLLMVYFKIQECDSLNPEASALLSFREKVKRDPYGAFANWNANDIDPCTWFGVHCVDGKVQMLNLRGFSLEGTLAPELGQLSNLRSLVLYKNSFSGFIPKEIGGLRMLELLDLRYNNLSGTLPVEIGRMFSLKCLFLRGNKFCGGIPSEFSKLNLLSDLQFDESLSYTGAAGTECIKWKFRNWYGNDKLPGGENCCDNLPSPSLPANNVQNVVETVRRRLNEEVSLNLAAAPAGGVIANPLGKGGPVTLSSGAFPAMKNHSSQPLVNSPTSSNHESQSDRTQVHHLSDNGSSGRIYEFVVPIASLFGVFFVAIFFIVYRKRSQETTKNIKQEEDMIIENKGEETTLDPKKTGLSSLLQKAFVAGVPKLHRAELEAACEDFSNVIDKHPGCIVYKGTLSSGVEVAVLSTTVSSLKDWSNRAEEEFRKKIDTLSRINHKNFVNLLGYCEEDEPFMRMMVFEYASNGTLCEHLHATEAETLDWKARVRIVMGVAYCLQHMHHDLNFPIVHPNLQSTTILLTEDYAAKIAEIGFWTDIAAMSKIPDEEISEHTDLQSGPDPEENVYSFGLLLLEIISGKVPYNREHGFLVNWAAEYLEDKKPVSELTDSTLTSVKEKELNRICEVIKECLNKEIGHRPTMKDITFKLREVIEVSPNAATPKLSPLWWAELEVCSMEAC